MDCLPNWCCWTVLPNGVIQHNFSQKRCHFTCLCAWASEGIFPGGTTSGFFSKRFSRVGQTWWNLFFTTRNYENSIFCWNFQIPSPLPKPICLCVGNVRATPSNNLGNFKHFNPAQEAWVGHSPGAFPFINFSYSEKCWKSVFPWLFLIFRDQWNSARVIFRKCPWKPIHKVYWVLYYPGYLMSR